MILQLFWFHKYALVAQGFSAAACTKISLTPIAINYEFNLISSAS